MRGACYSCLPCEDSQRWKVVGIGLRALAVHGKCFARDHVASRVCIVIHVIQTSHTRTVRAFAPPRSRGLVHATARACIRVLSA